MSEEKKVNESGLITGIYRNNMIWVPFRDTSRKFYEKSYYGNIYNKNEQQLLDRFEFVESNGSTGEVVIREDESIPLDKRPEYIVLHPLEALYLIERQKLEIQDTNDQILDFNLLLERSMEIDYRIWQKYIVYRDIRHRGYIIRVGFGGNADFRVYARGAKFANNSAKFVYFIVQDGVPVALNNLENVVTQVLGDRKNLILAIFDKLGDSTFYQLERFKFTKISNFNKQWDKNVEAQIIKKESQASE